jgi:hypothetical protein
LLRTGSEFFTHTLSYCGTFADWLFAEGTPKKFADLQINPKKFADLKFSASHTSEICRFFAD